MHTKSLACQKSSRNIEQGKDSDFLPESSALLSSCDPKSQNAEECSTFITANLGEFHLYDADELLVYYRRSPRWGGHPKNVKPPCGRAVTNWLTNGAWTAPIVPGRLPNRWVLADARCFYSRDGRAFEDLPDLAAALGWSAPAQTDRGALS